MQVSPEEIARVACTITAYLGPYRAWEENNETFFVTNVEISLNPAWIGGEQCTTVGSKKRTRKSAVDVEASSGV